MKRPRRLAAAITLSLFAVFTLTLAATLLYAVLSFRPYLYRLRAEDLEQRARLIVPQVDRLFELSPPLQFREADGVCAALGRLGGFRVTLIRPDGIVIGDSEREAEAMEAHGRRPEVLAALRGETGTEVRYSATVGREMLYVALPLYRGEGIIGVVRVSLPRLSVEDALRGWRTISLWVGVAGLAVAGAFVAWFARRITGPIRELRRGAERILARNLPEPLRLPEFVETNSLAAALNRLDAVLDEQSQIVTRQHSQERAILHSMIEGVVAIDPEKHVINLNEAAARMLKVRLQDVLGSRVEEVVRVPALLSFIERTMADGKADRLDARAGGAEDAAASREDTIAVYLDEPRWIRAQGTTLRGSGDEVLGYLVVLNDVTHLRRLERMRSDFVSNVSHELRTPITTIKGFAETLLDEGLKDPEQGLRFLSLIARETDRLVTLVEDLLSLARIEHEGERRETQFSRGTLAPVLRRAVAACAEAAHKAGIELRIECQEDLEANLNPPLLEQALGNLLDNAVKYSRRGARVEVSGSRSGGEIFIRVRDQGVGIAAEHLPRLFERFYRVDKARSRSLGGTGLGLAIVKHIALAHGGRVEVESTPGKGSLFSIVLPTP